MKAKNLLKKTIVGVLSFCMILTAALPVKAAASTAKFIMTPTYGQTEARSMLSMINEFRTGSDAWVWDSTSTKKEQLTGLKALTYDYALEKIAMQRAAELTVRFSHSRPDDTSNFSASYGSTSSYAENISAGLTTAKAAFTQWQETSNTYNSQSHRRAMLKKDYTAIGIAKVTYNGTTYWVQEFGFSSSGLAKTAAVDGEQDVTVTINTAYVKNETDFSKDGSFISTESYPSNAMIRFKKYVAGSTDSGSTANGNNGNSVSNQSGNKINNKAILKSINVSGVTYKVSGTGLTLTKAANKSKVIIPSTITSGGVKFKVTAIAANAFKGNKKLTSVTIGKNVKTIGSKAFYGCTKLKKVTIKSKSLKKIGKAAFKKAGVKKLKVKTPSGKKKTYKKLLKKAGLRKSATIK